ncbi:DUF305 domain-containing protein [Proteobacteria bacterium 005FR1]|nr:DUF305 domain-containing protein [Proteobacteria bacterium 005FR1]
MSYWRFAAMIATSTVVMFGLMYLNTYALEHVLWSETRLWMAFLMGASMAIIMLSFMLAMYRNTWINVGIYAGSVLVFAGSLWLVRSQITISGVDYMEAMVPHHSIAVMTSERARIDDPRVRKLADEIIEAQRREISEMKYLIEVLEEDGGEGTRTRTMEDRPATLMSAREALNSPALGTLDPSSMDSSEFSGLIGAGQYCSFSYTIAGRPVFVAGPSAEGGTLSGILKLQGHLVRLEPQGPESLPDLINGGRFESGPVGITVEPLPQEGVESGDGMRRWPANMLFALEQGLIVGYRGWYTCREAN